MIFFTNRRKKEIGHVTNFQVMFKANIRTVQPETEPGSHCSSPPCTPRNPSYCAATEPLNFIRNFSL